MAHEIILAKGKQQTNITNACSNITWSSHIEALGVELSFDMARGAYSVETGDQLILLSNKQPLNYFVVVTTSRAGQNNLTVTAFDRAWYLNKNETIIQFKKASASDAIGKLLDKFGVKHRITKMNTLIKKIYKDQTVSDIILDILEQVKQETGQQHRMEMDKDTLVIERQSELLINPYIKLSGNTYSFPIAKTVSNPTVERSIEDMKNNVIIVADGDDRAKVYTTLQDASSIAKYGLLTEVVTVDDKNRAQARNIAKTTLTELNKVNESVSCELLGHDDVRAGRTIELNEPNIEMVGKYLIMSASHTISNGIHKVSVELKGVR